MGPELPGPPRADRVPVRLPGGQPTPGQHAPGEVPAAEQQGRKHGRADHDRARAARGHQPDWSGPSSLTLPLRHHVACREKAHPRLLRTEQEIMSLRTRRGFITRPLRRLARRGAREWTDMAARPERPDVTPLADLLHGHSRAGPVREQRPVYVDLLPPCNAGCPAGENIQAWLAHAEAGRHEQAWRQLVADNPMPAIHGRVCYHPCESVCNRASLDSAVSIHSVERFLGDLALERGWSFDPPPVRSGKRVLVIGAGPSGLSAAYHLARLGHQVEIRDAGERPGGMMRYGIPAYRMPRDVLDAELDRIAAMGVADYLGPPGGGPGRGAARGRLRRGLRGRGRALVQAGRHPG